MSRWPHEMTRPARTSLAHTRHMMPQRKIAFPNEPRRAVWEWESMVRSRNVRPFICLSCMGNGRLLKVLALSFLSQGFHHLSLGCITDACRVVSNLVNESSGRCCPRLSCDRVRNRVIPTLPRLTNHVVRCSSFGELSSHMTLGDPVWVIRRRIKNQCNQRNNHLPRLAVPDCGRSKTRY